MAWSSLKRLSPREEGDEWEGGRGGPCLEGTKKKDIRE